jgi:hypothetical protein
MTTIMEVRLQCPVCATTFKSSTWSSTNTFGGQTTDFRPVAVGVDSLTLEIHTCPHCGYCARGAEDFEQDLSEATRTVVRERLETLAADSDPGPWTSYEVAARCAEWSEQSALKVADLYLRAAWMRDAAGLPAHDDRRWAMHFFAEGLVGDIPIATYIRVSYVVGECCRRIDDAEMAAKWYQAAIDALTAHRIGDEEDDLHLIAALAAAQMEDPKEWLDDALSRDDQ